MTMVMGFGAPPGSSMVRVGVPRWGVRRQGMPSTVSVTAIAVRYWRACSWSLGAGRGGLPGTGVMSGSAFLGLGGRRGGKRDTGNHFGSRDVLVSVLARLLAGGFLWWCGVVPVVGE